MTEPTAFDSGARPAERVAAPPDTARHAQPLRRSNLRLLAGLVVGVILLAGLAFYFIVPAIYAVETDDAYVDAHVVSVVPKVAAYVVALHITDNSKFAAGELLVELDPRDFQVAVDTAAADLKIAQANLADVRTQLREQQDIVAQSEATVSGDRATLTFARQELARYSGLAKIGVSPTQRWQQAQSDVGEREAALQRDLAALETARAHIIVLDAQSRLAEASIARQSSVLAQALLNLSYTKIFAVEAGTVADKTVEVGNFVQPGQVLFSMVPNDLYVTANYKETQITDVRPGQPVTIHVDAFPDQEFRGRVDSLQRGTGSQFALLPPENATGNFVKVVQRVPIKIVFDMPPEALRWIAPGMSVETTINVAQPPWWLWFLR